MRKYGIIVTVVTDAVNVAMELSKRKDLEVFVTGGFPAWGLGVNGIDAQKGLTSANPGEAAMNRVIVDQARKRIAVADHSKLGAVATHRFCGVRDIHIPITDTEASDDGIAPFLERGIEVLRV